MIRTFLFWAVLVVGFGLILPWLVLWTLLTRNPEVEYSFSMKTIRLALRAGGVRIHVDGAANIPDRACVFACNHASNLDPLVLFPSLPRRISVILKKDMMRIPVLGWAMRLAHFVPIDRDNRKAAAAALDRAVGLLRGGLAFVIFPEGSRSSDGRLRPFKRGALVMAIQSGAPIVPVSIGGTQRLMSKGAGSVQPGDVTIRFGLPMEAARFDGDRRDEVLRDLEAAVAAGLPPEQQPVRA